MNTRLALLSGIGLMALGIASASAQEQTAQANIPSITVTDTKQKAIDVAPSVAPLDAIQPESLVARKFIEENIPLSSNYDDVIKYTPSVNGVSPNGPGLMENQILSIRGFQDGQFNVTFDGIPWGDANDFTHHTTSYFMGHDLGSVLVDRGPGTAATIGNATFGGTIAVQSKDPLSTFTLNPYATYGSFNTSVVGGEVDSGRIEKYRDTTVLLDVEGLNSDGYLTNASQNRQNVFGKVVTPLGPTTTLTVVGMLNEIDQHFASGATAAQLAQFGPNFGLSKNPGDMNYFAYNHDIIQTDFEYAGVKSSFGDGWSLDAKVYTYAYYHSGTQGADQANTLTNNSISTFFGPGEVPGTLLQNDYRSIGTTDTIKKEFAYFDIQTGIWFDHQINRRSLFDVNLAGNNAIDTSLDANGVQREIHQTLDTIQPFVQVDVKPIPDLVISPGLRYDNFTRNISADVNQGSELPLQYNKTFDQLLPSLAVHYLITPGWAVYAQAANGFLAPNENTTYRSANPSNDPLKPQASWNYQIGSSYQTGPLTVSADAYYIYFGNLLKHESINGNTIFTNGGGAIYQGIEAEATYIVGWGASVFANASLNSAKFTSSGTNPGSNVSDSPKDTASLGVLYDKNAIQASLLGRFIGTRYGDATDAGGVNNIGLDPYFTMDASLGYTFGGEGEIVPAPTTVRLQVVNLTDNTKIYSNNGTGADGVTPTFYTIPGRSFFASLSAKF